MKEMKYRARAVKYVTHLEEVRINAQVEMARIQGSNMAMMMYIDRNFQRSLDYMQESYLKQSYNIEQSRRQMIQELNNQVQNHLGSINKRYIETVRENEMKCAMYRDFVYGSAKEGITQSDVTLFMAKKLAENMDRYNSRAITNMCGLIRDFMRMNTNITFEEYLNIQKKLKRL